MTVQLKVKWYINGQEWGATEGWLSLLDYEDVIAVATAQNISNIISELNQHSVEYYNKFLQNNLNENNSWYVLWRWFKEDPMLWTVREYRDYIDWSYQSYEWKNMWDMDINSIVYDISSSLWKTYYKEW